MYLPTFTTQIKYAFLYTDDTDTGLLLCNVFIRRPGSTKYVTTKR